MAGIATLQDSAHAIRRAFCYENGYLRDGTGERRVDAVHLGFAASMCASSRRPFPQVYLEFTIHVDGLGYVCIFAVLTSSDKTTSTFVTLSIFHPCLPTLTSTCACTFWRADEGIGHTTDRMSKDGEMKSRPCRSKKRTRMDSNRSRRLAVPRASRTSLRGASQTTTCAALQA